MKRKIFFIALVLTCLASFYSLAFADTKYSDLGVKIGEEVDISEGKIKSNCVYSYDIYSVLIDEDNKVSELFLKTSDAVTDEGIKIGSSINEVKETYPEGYYDEGIYYVERENYKIMFYVNEEMEEITAIVYRTKT